MGVEWLISSKIQKFIDEINIFKRKDNFNRKLIFSLAFHAGFKGKGGKKEKRTIKARSGRSERDAGFKLLFRLPQ